MTALRVKQAKNIVQKTVGLIGKKEPTSLLIKTRFGIHTFGLNYPIDVLILDQKNRVVKYQTDLMPLRILFWSPKFETVIELPSGTIHEKKIKVGDTITINVETD